MFGLLACTCRSVHQGGRSVGSTKRVRQHVNPLRSGHQNLLTLPENWPSFAEPANPLHVDIGCARGYWCLDFAEAHPHVNVLGLEIRRALAEAAQGDVSSRALTNVEFVPCNANVNLRLMLAKATQSSPLRSASLQFPDPWFKAKHHKRRTLQPPLVSTIADYLEPGGWLLLQTDVLDLAEDMREIVRATEGGRLIDARSDPTDWGVDKPSQTELINTERERACHELGRPIYRCLFTKAEAHKSM